MYYVIEVLSSTKTKVVNKEDNLLQAKKLAVEHSYRTGLEVDIQTESGKVLDRIIVWRDE